MLNHHESSTASCDQLHTWCMVKMMNDYSDILQGSSCDELDMCGRVVCVWLAQTVNSWCLFT